MKRFATRPQREQVLNLFAQQKLTAEQMQTLFSCSALSLLAEATAKVNLENIDPFKFASALGMPEKEVVPFGRRFKFDVDVGSFSFWRFEHCIDTPTPLKSAYRLYSLNCGAIANAPALLAKNKLIGCNQYELSSFYHYERVHPDILTSGFILLSTGTNSQNSSGPTYWQFPVFNYAWGHGFFHSFRGDDVVRNGGDGKCLFLARRASSQAELENYVTDFVEPSEWTRVLGHETRSKPFKQPLM